MNYLKKGLILALSMTAVLNLGAQAPDVSRVTAAVRSNVLRQARWALKQKPVTVTAFRCERSAGGSHDFYSEGDYWWPDPENPDGPYVQRDGQTNPANFVAHRKAMIRFSRIVGALASAYVLTGDKRYVAHAATHLKAWFADSATYMIPSLRYAQAIKGRVTGRGIGIIDTIHLMEVAQSVRVMAASPALSEDTRKATVEWFERYLVWLTSHPYGNDEMNAENNHGTCWVMQVAAFASLTNDEKLLDFCRERYRSVLLPGQMASDGSFPRELRRTKPYGYSLFNLDAMATVCQILSKKGDNLWQFQTADGRSIGKGIEYLYPFVRSKNDWPFPKDVMYWNEWPVAHPFLVFGGLAFGNGEWIDTWTELDHAPETDEVIRNLPVRNPLIWISDIAR